MPAPRHFMVLNGPNLNMLGQREPEIYGGATLGDIEAACRKRAAALGVAIDFRQSNSEAELVDWIQAAKNASDKGGCDGIIINAAAYTHTSIAILDALLVAGLPVVEVHLSHPLKRERFRHRSYVAGAAMGLICGFGGHGYVLAIEAMAQLLGAGNET